MRAWILVLCCCGSICGQDVVGWRGDGYGNFPDAKPVLQWDDKSSRHIAFRCPLPNWSQSSPVVFEDDQGKPVVLVMSEALDWKPILLAIDGETGTERWRVELDHRPGEVEDIKQRWSKGLERTRVKNRLRSLLNDAHRNLQNDPEDSAAKQAKAALIKEVEAMGFTAEAPKNPRLGNDRGDGWSIKDPQNTLGRMEKDGFGTIAWGMGNSRYAPLTWVGHSFPTPVVDKTAKAIYAYTAHHGVHRLSYDGSVQWTRWLGAVPRQSNHITTNPILRGKHLIIGSSQYDWITVLDSSSGEEIWTQGVHPSAGKKKAVVYSIFGVHTPRIVTVDGVDFIYFSSGKLFRLHDGQLIFDDLAKGARLGGSAHVRGNRLWVTWHIRGDTQLKEIAYEFNRDGDSVSKKILWEQKPERGRVHLSPAVSEAALHDGRIFSRNGVIDTATGKTLKPLPWPFTKQPATGKSKRSRTARMPIGMPFSIVGKRYLVAGGKYGQDMNRKGVYWVFDLQNDSLVSENQLDYAPVDAERETFIRRESARSRWLTFSQSSPFFWRDRIYIRSFDYLYGIWQHKNGE